MNWREASEQTARIIFHYQHPDDMRSDALLNLTQGEPGQAVLHIDALDSLPAANLMVVSQSIRVYGLDDENWTV